MSLNMNDPKNLTKTLQNLIRDCDVSWKRYKQFKTLDKFKEKLYELVQAANSQELSFIECSEEQLQAFYDTATRFNQLLQAKDRALAAKKEEPKKKGFLWGGNPKTGYRLLDTLELTAKKDSIQTEFLKTLSLGEEDTVVNLNVDSRYPTLIEKNGRFNYKINEKDHAKEAGNIFFSTQWKRIKANISQLLGKLGIHVFEDALYFRSKEQQGNDYLYRDDTPTPSGETEFPSTYHLGHATNLISLPTKNGGLLRGLTDPVSGDLNAILYPRRTKLARPFASLPSIDFILISHNHRDHVDEKSLKLFVKQQPLMIVPEGDEALFERMGFKRIVSLKWWEEKTLPISDHEGAEIDRLHVTGVASKHWTGRGPFDAHASTPCGALVSTETMAGNVYVAGDTAKLSNDNQQAIMEIANKKPGYLMQLQPAGPDDKNKDMKSTHKPSVALIYDHFRAFKARCDAGHANLDELVTVVYHHGTFMLGNLHIDDAHASVARMRAALRSWYESGKHYTNTVGFQALKSYERKYFHKITRLLESMSGPRGELTAETVDRIIAKNIILPKIGERVELNDLPHARPLTRDALCTNKRAAAEFEAVYEENKEQDAKAIIGALVKTYNKPWHSRLTRHHHSKLRNLVGADLSGDRLATELGSLAAKTKHNPEGHFASLLKYSLWAVQEKEGTLKKYASPGVSFS